MGNQVTLCIGPRCGQDVLVAVDRQHNCTTRHIFIIMALTENNTADIDISTKVAFLRQPASYHGHSAKVNVIKTHMSWVFLTDRLVYKLKKQVY